MILRPAPPDHYQWLAGRASVIVGPALRCIEAIGEQGQIVGMVGIEIGMPGTAVLHIAVAEPNEIPRELRRVVVRMLVVAAFRTVFLGLWKRVAVCQVLSTNTRSLSLVRRVGFREVFRGKDYWDEGVDLVCFEMRREECRWIPQDEQKEAA